MPLVAAAACQRRGVGEAATGSQRSVDPAVEMLVILHHVNRDGGGPDAVKQAWYAGVVAGPEHAAATDGKQEDPERAGRHVEGSGNLGGASL